MVVKRYIVLWILLWTTTVLFCKKKDYTGYKLLTAKVKTEAGERFLRRLQDSNELDLTFWNDPSRQRPTPVIVSARNFEKLKRILDRQRIEYTVDIDNVQTFVDESTRRPLKQPSSLPDRIYLEFLDYNEIIDYLNSIATDHPDRVTVTEIGRTFQDRPIQLVKISSNSTGPKKEVWIEVGTHAREWGAVSSGLIVIDKLISGSHDSMLETLDWYIIPVHNPDGYQYSHKITGKLIQSDGICHFIFHKTKKTTDRFWRKNRRRNRRFWCRRWQGVDLNRNWEVGFGGAGSSRWCRSEVYRGLFALSEPETKAVDDAISASDGNVVAFFAIHTYGQYILTPFGLNSLASPQNNGELISIGEEMRDAIESIDGKRFIVGNSAQALYEAGGTSNDHMYRVRNISLSYTFELRPNDEQGFVLPTPEIPIAAEELFAALKRFTEVFRK